MVSRNKLTMCRLCLSENVCFINIFEFNDRQGYVAAEAISDLLKFQVSETDVYPHVVCSKCLLKLTDFRQFKECCQKSMVTYDNMFVPRENLEEHKPEIPIIKQEELDISGDESAEPFDGTNTESVFGPILLKNEMLKVYSDGQKQEEIIESEEFVNVDPVVPPATIMEDTTQEADRSDIGSELCEEDGLREESSDVELPLLETDAHPKYPHCLEKKRSHFTSTAEIEADSCTWSITTNDELKFEKIKNISLSEEVEAFSSGTMERLECHRILPGDSMYMDPLSHHEKERVKMEKDIGDREYRRGTGQEKVARKRREGLECFHCGIVLTSKLGLIRHMKVHGFVNSYDCAECGKAFRFNYQFKTHLLTHTLSEPHKCEKCRKHFSRSSSLKTHMSSHTGSKPYKCEECSKSFSRSSSLKTHMSSHTGSKPYSCTVCNKSFSNNSNLKRHIRIHTGSKPYKCSECSKSFNHSSNLKTHMRLHTGCKPHKCEECSKSFSHKYILKNHMRLHTGSKPYKCEECSKSFIHGSSLKTHMRLHIGSIKYKCTDCSKSFSQSCNLKKHMRLHTGSKPYKCSECSKIFNQSSNLNTHMRLHTGCKSYKCADCSKGFSQSSHLKTHMKLHTH